MIGLAIVMPLIGSGAMWPLAVEAAADTCRHSWWTNLVFVNNLMHPDNVCLYTTWYLSASMQYHVIGCVVLYILYR